MKTCASPGRLIALNPSRSSRGSGHTRHVNARRAGVLFGQVQLASGDMQ